MEVNGGEIQARTLHAKGKQTTLRFKGKHHDLQSDAIQKIRVVGRGEATSAQAARDTFIMQLLQGEAVLDRSEFVRLLWFPSGVKIQKNVPLAQHHFPDLNPSQRSVANAMILGEDPFITVHGK